jgi:hypothetical protein
MLEKLGNKRRRQFLLAVSRLAGSQKRLVRVFVLQQKLS